MKVSVIHARLYNAEKMKRCRKCSWIRLVCAMCLVVAGISFIISEAVPPERSQAEGTSPKLVKVGGYIVPPYVREQSGQFTGLTLSLPEVMNRFSPLTILSSYPLSL